MFSPDFFNIFIHIVNILIWAGIVLFVVRWLVRRNRGQHGA